MVNNVGARIENYFSCFLKYIAIGVVLSFNIFTSNANAEIVEIPYVPFEVSTFPESLKKLCNEAMYYGINELCGNLKKGTNITVDELKALKYAWRNENILLNKNDEDHSKSKSVLKAIIDKNKENDIVVEWGPEITNFDDEVKKGEASTKVVSTEKFSSLEEKFINGLAEFVVTRAKAEASFFFQEKLKEELCDKEENKKYFSNTCVALDTLQLSLSLNAMGGFLRAAVKKDIETLPDFFLKDAIFMAVDNKAIDVAETLMTTRLLIGVYTAAKDGMTPYDILRGLSNIDEILKCEDPTQNPCSDYNSTIINKLKKISKLYKAYETNIYYSDTNGDLKTRASEDWPYISVGLIFTYYEDEGKIENINNISSNMQAIIKNFQELQELVSVINQPVSINFTKNYDPKERLNERIKAMNKMFSLIATLYQQTKILGVITDDVSSISNKLISNLHKYASMSEEILRGDEAGYMQSFLMLVSQKSKQMLKFSTGQITDEKIKCLISKDKVINFISSNSSKTGIEQLNELLGNREFCKKNIGEKKCNKTGYDLIKTNRDFLEKEYPDLVPKIKDESILGDEIKGFIPVMVEIANAETSKDVANIIETAAAPVGSYREKAKRQMLSITALFGPGFAGREHYTLDDDNKSHHLGIQTFAPIGFEYSRSLKPNWCTLKNVGGFISLIDLGPIVSTETESGVKSDTKVDFRQLFSPGLYIKFQLLGPINIGYGISKTPDVMKSDKPEGEAITDAWRHQFFIALDLTLFPF